MRELSIVFLVASGYFFIATAAGLFRFRLVYARLHSAGKSLTGGAVSIVIFVMLQSDSGADIARLAVTTVFLLATSTLGTHARRTTRRSICTASKTTNTHGRSRQASWSESEPDNGTERQMLEAAVILLCLFLTAIAVYTVNSTSVFAAIIAMDVFSIVLTAIFVVLRAPDVAMTEAVIGAGLTTAFFVIALDKTRDTDGDAT